MDRTDLRRVLVSITTGLLYGLVARLSSDTSEVLAIMTLAFVALVPLAMGYITVALLPQQGKRTPWWRAIVAGTVIATLVTCLVGGLEGMICAIMMAPLFLFVAMIGGQIALRVRRSRSRRMHAFGLAAMALLPYVAAPVEQRLPWGPGEMRTVRNEIRIRATPDAVWRNIVRVPPIDPAEYGTSFVHRMGFPRPVEATLSHEGLGGVRAASFERGVVFRETVTEWRPMRALSFTIAPEAVPASAMDPHVAVGGRYFDVLDGTYEIEDVGNGEVILHLRSTHRLSTHFNPYASLWSDLVMWQIQGNILEVVKRRAEGQGGMRRARVDVPDPLTLFL